MKRSLLVAVFSVWVVCGMCANDTLTRREIYNFEVGDTFEYKHTKNSTIPLFGSSGIGYSLAIIENVFTSFTGDTLTIERRNIYSLTQSSNETLVITELDSFEVFRYFLNEVFCTVSIAIDTNSQFNDRTSNKRFIEIDLGCGGKDSTFAEGLGMVHSYDGFGDGLGGYVDYETELIYFSKDNERWGTFHTLISGINEVSKNKVAISPNPATTSLTIQTEELTAPKVFQLLDVTGRMVLLQPLTDKTTRIDVSAVSKGMYLYSVVSEKQKAGAGKLIIE